jgi:hypothetical protein
MSVDAAECRPVSGSSSPPSDTVRDHPYYAPYNWGVLTSTARTRYRATGLLDFEDVVLQPHDGWRRKRYAPPLLPKHRQAVGTANQHVPPLELDAVDGDGRFAATGSWVVGRRLT